MSTRHGHGRGLEQQGCLGSSQQMGRIGLVLNAFARAGEDRESTRMSLLAALRMEEYVKGTSRGSEMKQYQSHHGGKSVQYATRLSVHLALTRPLYGLCSS